MKKKKKPRNRRKKKKKKKWKAFKILKTEPEMSFSLEYYNTVMFLPITELNFNVIESQNFLPNCQISCESHYGSIKQIEFEVGQI